MEPVNSILCMMPTRDRPDTRARSALDLAAAGCGCPVSVQPGQPRDFNRNRCVRQFLDHPKNFQKLLFVDDDTTIPEDAIRRLAAVDRPIVSGVQPLWLHGVLVASVKLPDGPAGEPAPWPDWVTWDRPAEPFRIGFCGFGCVLIRREVFDAVGHPWFCEDHGDVWGVNNRTEDVDFCLKAAKAGFEIWCEPGVVCGHLKAVDLRDWLPRSQVHLTVNRPTTAGE